MTTRRWRSVPAAVWWLTGLLCALLAAYSVLLPTYRAPDEPHHLDLIRKVRSGHGYPDLHSSYISEQVMASLPLVDFASRSRNLEADAALSRSDRPALAELAVDQPSAQTNQMPQHPPLYYTVAAVQTTILSAYAPGLRGASYDAEVALYRLLNLLFIVPLPLLGFIAAQRLRLPRPIALAAAAVPLGIPMMVHVGSSVTNDNLLTLLFTVTLVALCGVWQGDDRWRTGVVIGATVALALLTKAFAFVLFPWIVGGYALGYYRTRQASLLGPGLLALAISIVGGGWWWVRTVVTYGTLLPSRGVQREAPPDFEANTVVWIGDYLEWISARFWGWFGWVDVRLPPVAVILATAFLGVGLGLVFLPRRPPIRRFEAASLLFPTVALLFLTMANSYRNYLATGVADTAVQGRYLFPGAVGLGLVAMAGIGSAAGRWQRWLPVWVLTGVGILQVVSASRIMSTFWGSPTEDWTGRIEALVAWAAWPPVISLGVLLSAIALLGVALVAVWPGNGRTARATVSDSPA